MWIYIFMIVVHWIGDFVLQTRQMADNKSKSNYYLSQHVFVYTVATIILWLIFMPLLFNVECSFKTIFLAMLLIFATHWPTDYVTSRLTSRFYKIGNFKLFFTTIGFDQILHYLQVFAIYQYIILK